MTDLPAEQTEGHGPERSLWGRLASGRARALFVTAYAIAFLITRRFQAMLVTAVAVAVTASVAGIYLSFLIDSAPAPTIVLLMSAMFVAAFLRTVWKSRNSQRSAVVTDG